MAYYSVKHFILHLKLQITKLLNYQKNKIQELHTRQETKVLAKEPIPYQ